MSAGTLSPDWSSTTSPGTSWDAGIRLRSPARTTVASVPMYRASAAIALWALVSWMNPMVAVTRTTPRMTMASIHSPNTAVMNAATSRMRSSG